MSILYKLPTWWEEHEGLGAFPSPQGKREEFKKTT